MVSPADRRVDIPIEGGFVGMVDRDQFDEWLRERAAAAGAVRARQLRAPGARDDGTAVVHFETEPRRRRCARGPPRCAHAASSAPTARAREVARRPCPAPRRRRYVFAYHEIVQRPRPCRRPTTTRTRCDVSTAASSRPTSTAGCSRTATRCVGTGSADKGFSLRNATATLRKRAGLDGARPLRREGAPIPMKPLPRWDNGRDVVLAGDAAGVVAPASGEGIYYAMTGGRLAAEAAAEYLRTGDGARWPGPQALHARARPVFWVLGIMQRFWYSSDKRRERFVSICRTRTCSSSPSRAT
jgi:geranylgeranyl diphosphate/geranylgeranyl-bacteriochlorophyllide a reductase